MLVFVLGCASLTPERLDVLAQIAGLAAQEGAKEWLKKHPDHRLAFDAVIASIAALVKQGETREFKYSELLQSLPTATLAGTEGAVYVTGTSNISTNKEQDRIIVYDERTKKAYHVGGDIRVQRQIVAGLKRAMLPLPPVPPAPGKAARPVPVWRSAVSITGQHPVLSHDGAVTKTNQIKLAGRTTRSIRQPAVVRTNQLWVGGRAPTNASEYFIWSDGKTTVVNLTGKTNVTRSVVDVTRHPGSASTVNIRWVLGPKSVYHFENRNPEIRINGDTNWYCEGSLTNISGTGPTNWTTTWPALVPIGTWRVLRVR